jgi:hypothetical protein
MRMRCWLLLTLALLAPGPVRGGLFDPIDVRKRADLGDPRVESRLVPLVPVETLAPQRAEHYRRAPVSDRRAAPGGIVERTPYRDQTRVEHKIADRGDRLSGPRIPHQNFVPRHGVVVVERVPTGYRPRPRAEINPRVIHTGTPAGQEELKNQLGRLH